MDGTLILEQHTILIRIASFLRTFKNAGLKSTPLPVLLILLGMVISTLSYLYYKVITYLDSIIYFIFWTSLLILYPAPPAKEIK